MTDAALADIAPSPTDETLTAGDDLDGTHAAWLGRVTRAMVFFDAEASILDCDPSTGRSLIEGTARRSRAWVSVRTRAVASDAAADRIGRRLRRRLRSDINSET